MDQELIAYLDQRFDTMDQRLKDLRWEMNQRFEKVDGRFDGLEETVHLSGVVVESLRDELRLVAEGFMGYSDQMEKHAAEVDRKLDDLKALIGPTYRSLEQKTDVQVTEIRRRVVVLEERAARETRDILEVVREKYGFAQPG
jgi:SMC interacting uncharacterized protein involved in chromosome segregation